MAQLLRPAAAGDASTLAREKRIAAQRITQGVIERIATLEELGLGLFVAATPHTVVVAG